MERADVPVPRRLEIRGSRRRERIHVWKMLSGLASFIVADYAWPRVPYALTRMAFEPSRLAKTEGLIFFKMGGTGQGLGFDARPNWRRYVLFAVWQSPWAWEKFLASSGVMFRIRDHAREMWWVSLKPVRSLGRWNGRELFEASGEMPSQGPVAVLTRATIRWNRLGRFWSEVGAVSSSLEKAKGLLCSVGFGEVPWVRQGTFSIWESAAAFQTFAYESQPHMRVIERARSERWYGEDLFARLIPVASGGTWNGRNPLEVRKR